MRLSKRKLSMLLSRVPRFPRAKAELEQYVSDPDVVAEIIVYLNLRGVRLRSVADLGCGTGMITYALAISDVSGYIVCIDIDEDALRVAREFLHAESIDAYVEYVLADALNPPMRSVEAVVMNPPFGIRSRRGLDIEFLKSALRIATRLVLSIHAWSEGLIKAVRRKTGCSPRILFEGYQRIPQFLEEHRRRVHLTRVVVLEVEPGCGPDEKRS